MHQAMLKVDCPVNQVVAGKTGLSVRRGEIAIAAERNASPGVIMSFGLIERWRAYVAAPGKPWHLQALARYPISPLLAWCGFGLA